MTIEHWLGALTLGVLSWTLVVLRGYADATREIACAAGEQLPRPCVVLERSADSSINAGIDGTACSLTDPLKFVNVGAGPAVNCRYRVVKNTEGTWYRLSEIAPGGTFKSEHPRNGLQSENAVTVIIEYESVGGLSYRTELRIDPEHGKFVQETSFHRPALNTF